MVERCQATAASGKPCSATPRPGRSFCLWHDPAAEEDRRELSRKGGRARSNASRAKKAFPAGLTTGEVQGYLATALKGVLVGRFTPGQANAVASAGPGDCERQGSDRNRGTARRA
jgi:hypothetical protein